MLVNLENNMLLEFYGFDEEGNRHEPPLLEELRVEELILEMIGMLRVMRTPEKWEKSQLKETIGSEGRKYIM